MIRSKSGVRSKCLEIFILLFFFDLQIFSIADTDSTDTPTDDDNGYVKINVMDFGAISDGETDSTRAFMRAWEKACSNEGKQRIVIPEGSFLVGPLEFKGPCNGTSIAMQIKGELKASTDLSIFHNDQWISFDHVDNLKITGTGKLNGQGASAWPFNQCSKKKDCEVLPTSLKLNYVSNATVSHISSVDSKSFHIVIFESTDVTLHHIKITADRDSPNTDGIHIGDSTNVKISQSIIGTGDDCVSIGPGSTNVDISDIYCGPGHGISVGSLGRYAIEDNVRGLTVTNCTLTGTTNGVRVKTWQSSTSSSASDLMFKGIVMRNVTNPIIIDQEYCPYASCADKTPSMVKISNIKFENIRGTSASKVAVNLVCSKAVPCKDVELNEIDLKYVEQGVITSSLCSNVDGIAKGSVTPPPCF